MHDGGKWKRARSRAVSHRHCLRALLEKRHKAIVLDFSRGCFRGLSNGLLVSFRREVNVPIGFATETDGNGPATFGAAPTLSSELGLTMVRRAHNLNAAGQHEDELLDHLC